MPPAPAKPFQFGLLAIFVATTLVALLSLLFRIDGGLATLGVFVASAMIVMQVVDAWRRG